MVDLTSITPDVGADAARGSIRAISAETQLCTIATCSEECFPNAATAFYVIDEPNLLLHLLTDPETVHGRDIRRSERAAFTIFASSQGWTDEHRGLQVSGEVALTAPSELEDVVSRYTAAYPGFGALAQNASDMSKILPQFFTLSIERVKILDEVAFGQRVWVEADVSRE